MGGISSSCSTSGKPRNKELTSLGCWRRRINKHPHKPDDAKQHTGVGTVIANWGKESYVLMLLSLAHPSTTVEKCSCFGQITCIPSCRDSVINFHGYYGNCAVSPSEANGSVGRHL